MQAAELSTSSRNDLPDSSFAGPNRSFPVQDESHARAAISRFPQAKFDSPAAKRSTAKKILAAARKFGIDVAADSAVAQAAKMAEPLLIAMAEEPIETTSFGEGKPLPFVRVSDHHFADYGDVVITEEDLDRIVANHKASARRGDLPICNEEHLPPIYTDAGEVQMGPGAVGWIKDMYRDGDTVYFVPDWNPAGERLLQEDRYRGISPELLLDWTDPETGQQWGMTAAGVALTNKPRMKNLAHQGSPMAAHEGRVLAFAELADVHIDSATPTLSVAWTFNDPKRLPLHTAEAVKGAKARFMTVEASESERDQAWSRLRDAAHGFGIPVPASWRELKASECMALLMQEGDGGEDDAGLQPPCMYQPPFGVCPGYTRSDPDNDGDADCCALAGRGCNGYVPIPRAIESATNTLPYGYSEPLKKGPTGGPTLTEDTKEQTAGAAAPETGAGVKASEPSPDQPKPEPQKTPEPQPEPVAASAGAGGGGGAADFAEMRNLLAAEQRERQAQTTRLEAAERDAKDAREQVRRMEQATEMAKVSDRLDSLVRSGRVTPAEITVYRENIAKFAEDDWMLKGLEQRPENSAVDLRERGRSGDDAGQLSDSAKLDLAAKAHMSERKQAGDSITYKQALLHVAKAGYQG